jgi:hypothetical protein
LFQTQTIAILALERLITLMTWNMAGGMCRNFLHQACQGFLAEGANIHNSMIYFIIILNEDSGINLALKHLWLNCFKKTRVKE